MSAAQLVLDQTQKQALKDLKDKLCVFARRQTAIQDPHRQPELSNVFAILGGRGTGKSTVLKRLYQNWEESDQGRTLCHSAPNQSDPRLYLVLQPLDCSVLPGDLAPGAAVLLWLKKERNDKL